MAIIVSQLMLHFNVRVSTLPDRGPRGSLLTNLFAINVSVKHKHQNFHN